MRDLTKCMRVPSWTFESYNDFLYTIADIVDSGAIDEVPYGYVVGVAADERGVLMSVSCQVRATPRNMPSWIRQFGVARMIPFVEGLDRDSLADYVENHLYDASVEVTREIRKALRETKSY